MTVRAPKHPLISALSLALALHAVAFAQDRASEESLQRPLRVVTYNIKRGYGNDGRIDLDRTAEVLRQLNPDLVGLQEVDENVRRSGHVDQAAVLGERLGMHHAFAPFMDFDGGRYGLAVLSRFPLQDVRAIELPVGNEPRVALAAGVDLPGDQDIVLVNLHFDWVRDDGYRFAQATKLRESLDRLTKPYVLLGDFNDVRGSRTLQLLSADTADAVKPADDPFTIPSDRPAKEIDFVFAAPQNSWRVGTVQVIDEPVASDHRPVLAELSLSATNPDE